MEDRERLRLLCEYADEPLTVQAARPRFSWYSPEPSGMQAAYRLRVADSREGLDGGDGSLLWDSGDVTSPACAAVRYEGRPLEAGREYWWSVTVFHEGEDRPATGGPARFETALRTAEDWAGAEWVMAVDHEWGVTDLFRQVFTLDQRPDRARLYISGIGYYEAFLDGRKIGDRVLEPGWTDYRKRVLYSVYDLTDALPAGEHVLGVELGEGWYGHRHDCFDRYMGTQPGWNDIPRLIYCLKLWYGDGTARCLTSGPGAVRHKPGAVTANSIYDGETCDARRELAGWHRVGFDASEWRKAAPANPPGGVLTAQQMPPVKVLESLSPAGLETVGHGRYLADFGRNIAGWAAIRVTGPAGASVTIRYAETRTPSGTNQANLRDARCTDRYILKGGGPEEWHPRFTYHGFRYAEFELAEGAELLAARADVVGTAVRQTGRFHCDNEVLNRCFEAVIATERGNMHGIPTDCPQRDERMAWLNDMTVRCEEGMLNFDVRLFYEKWMDDIADAQAECGSIPDTAPYVYGGNPAFHISSCFVLIPWFFHLYYHDDSLIRRFYPRLKRYVGFLASQRGGDGLIGVPYHGDWAPPAAECDRDSDWSAVPAQIPAPLITTGYLAYDCRLMSRMAAIAERPGDAEEFDCLAREAAEAINRRYCDGSGYGGTQAADIFPLFLGIAPRPDKVLAHLLRDLDAHGGHITTGNQMTKYWFEVLNRYERNDVAMSMARDTTYPSLGFMLENGATTIWERWECLDGGGMNSHNHPMNAAYTAWYYKGIAGIEADGDGGWIVTPGIGLVTSARASVMTPNGRLSVAFQCVPEEKAVDADIVIPWNTGAVLRFRACSVIGTAPSIAAGVEKDGVWSAAVTAGAYRLRVVPK